MTMLVKLDENATGEGHHTTRNLILNYRDDVLIVVVTCQITQSMREFFPANTLSIAVIMTLLAASIVMRQSQRYHVVH